MKIDMSYPLSKQELDGLLARMSAKGSARFGHFGTHFDSEGKDFPLSYTERPGVVFDVSGIRERDVEAENLDLGRVGRGSFVLLRTGMIENSSYGSAEYFSSHPQLAWSLIEDIVAAGASMIGIDMAGVRRGAEHARADRFCADEGTFIVENLVNLGKVCEAARDRPAFTVHTYPLNLSGLTGLPARVVAEFC